MSEGDVLPIEAVFKELTGKPPEYKDMDWMRSTGEQPTRDGKSGVVKLSNFLKPNLYELTIKDGGLRIRIEKVPTEDLNENERAAINPYLPG